jgi:hypothetical protein
MGIPTGEEESGRAATAKTVSAVCQAAYYSAPRWRWPSEKRQRLAAEIAGTVAEFETRARGTTQSPSVTEAVGKRGPAELPAPRTDARADAPADVADAVGVEAWIRHGRRLGQEAERAFIDHNHKEAAWALLLKARRCLVPLMDGREKNALVVSLKQEATKVGGWRQKAIQALLERRPFDDALIMESLLHIDVSSANRFRAARSRVNELGILAIILVVALVSATLLLSSGRLNPDDVGFGNARLVILVQLFGIVGACLSGVARTSGRPQMKVPDERAAAVASIIRPVTGAAGGLLALAGAQAGIVSRDFATALLGAFAAGFSERFVLKFLPDDSKEKTDDNQERSQDKPLAGVGAATADKSPDAKVVEQGPNGG